MDFVAPTGKTLKITDQSLSTPTQQFSSGILYNPETHQVLLQKRDADALVNPAKWGFFGGVGEEGETPVQTLIRELQEELGISIAPDQAKPFCDYFIPALGFHRYTFYAECRLDKNDMHLEEGEAFDWFSLDDALQLNLTKYTRQDLLTFKEKVLR